MSATQKHLDSKLMDDSCWPQRHTLVCQDGFTVSVQASSFHYSSPRDNNGVYTAVELGFPSEWPGTAIAEYRDGSEGDIYTFVPIGLVDDLIARHGGVKL